MSSDIAAVDSVVAFLAERREQYLSGTDLSRIKLLILDALGCMVAGLSEDAVISTMGQPVSGRSAPGRDTLAGQMGPWMEPFVRGVALRYLDFLDVYVSRDICHPSEHLPAALHIAESTGASGRDFLAALAVGYEVQTRLADTADLRAGGFHHVTAAAVSVPVVAARLGAVGPAELGHAVSLAVAQGVVLRSVSRGAVSMAKAFAFPLAARRAMDSVVLAAQGVTGPVHALDDLLRLTGTDSQRLCDTFGRDPAANDHLAAIQLKTFPVQYALQSIVECGIALHPTFRARRSEVAAVRVGASPMALDNTTDAAKRHAATREAADHSLYSCLAMALTLGHVDPTDFAECAWTSPEARRVADLVRVKELPGTSREPNSTRRHPLAASVHLDFRDGETAEFSVPAPLGSPGRPLSDHQVITKFMTCASPAVGSVRARQIVDAVFELESSPSVRRLGDLLKV